MQSVKQGRIKFHFFSLWYDSIWDWTQVSQTIGEYFNHYANGIREEYLEPFNCVQTNLLGLV